jgi:hypothetical protein
MLPRPLRNGLRTDNNTVLEDPTDAGLLSTPQDKAVERAHSAPQVSQGRHQGARP